MLCGKAVKFVAADYCPRVLCPPGGIFAQPLEPAGLPGGHHLSGVHCQPQQSALHLESAAPAARAEAAEDDLQIQGAVLRDSRCAYGLTLCLWTHAVMLCQECVTVLAECNSAYILTIWCYVKGVTVLGAGYVRRFAV